MPAGTWTGDRINAFTGIFDGNGFSIDGLYINRIESGSQGLFGALWGAAVQNVILTNAEVTGDHYIGTLAGLVVYESVITHCWATGNVKLKSGSGDAKSGGLIGSVSTDSRIDQCFSGVNVNAGRRMQVGGLVGYLRGRGHDTQLTNSYSHGTVTGTGYKQGNLLGDADASRVDKCYSSGNGKALIGFNWKSPVITNCYWDKDKGASSSSYGGIGKTTDQMMQQATFVDWDFDEIWAINEGQSYPYLQWDISYILGGLFDALVADVIEFVQDESIENILLVTLDMVLQKLMDEAEVNNVAAINSLQAFINAVEAQSGREISQENANNLIETAQQIIGMLQY